MQKILTIFERDWNGNKGVINKFVKDFDFSNAIATEKLNGTNVRLTVRNKILVRLEKRCNPSKLQKIKGIIEPWYIDADENNSEDKYIWEAARNTDLSNIFDGEWSGEAVGIKIQGNSLNLKNHTVILFSLGKAPIFKNVPIAFDELKEWLPKQKSLYGENCGIEGIVWHWPDGKMAKIKCKDFK